MMTRSRIAALALCAVLLLTLAGCSTQNEQDSAEAASFISENTPAAMYQEAAASVHAAKDFSLQINAIKSTTKDGQIFTQISQQTLSYLNYGTQDMLASMEETLRIGDHSISIREVYSDGTGYFTVNGSRFTGSMSGDAYCARYTPSVLFDTTLYKSIFAQEDNGSIILSFRQPANAEDWAVPEGAQLTNAYGHALLDTNGNLKASNYTVTYSYGAANVTLSVAVSVDITAPPNIDVPADTSGYTPLEHLDAPRLLEQACGYLLQASSVSAVSTESIACQAFAINREQTTELKMSGNDSDLAAQVNNNITQINHSRGGEITNIQQTESFLDGVYTIATNGGTPSAIDTVTSETMLTYCQDILVGSVLLPEYISDTAVTETTTTYRLTFTASEALAEAVCAKVCQTLYNDPDLLNNLATSYVTDSIVCYLEIDKYTGLPTASGIRYSGSHTIEGSTYQLSSQTDQTYTLSAEK